MSHKECVVCGAHKPLGEYYFRRDSQTYRSECKECIRAKKRERYRTPEGKKAMRESYDAWRRSEKGKRWTRAIKGRYTTKAHRERDSQAAQAHRRTKKGKAKMRANNAVGGKVRWGKLPKASEVPCSDGPEDCYGKHHWHHDSYEAHRRLDVRCLCASHHVRWHQKNEPKFDPWDED